MNLEFDANVLISTFTVERHNVLLKTVTSDSWQWIIIQDVTGES